MQKHGYEDRQWHCGLGHTSRSLQRGTWHKVEIHRQWPSGETPRFSKGTKVIECSIENFVTVVAVTKQKVVPSIEFSSAKGNFESGQGVEDTMMDLFKPFREGSDVHDASYSTPQAGVAQSKESSVPNQQETIMCSLLVFTHYPKHPNCEVCKKTKTTRARCRTKPEKRVDGIALSTTFGALITADHKILTDENESRCGHKNALIVQGDCTNRLHSYPIKTKETPATMSCLPIFLLPSQKRVIITQTFPEEFVRTGQNVQWNHDTRTPHPWETNGVAERAVRRVREGTAIAQVHGGLCGGKTPFEKRYCQTCDGPSIPFGTLVEYIPINAKDKSRIYQFGRKR